MGMSVSRIDAKKMSSTMFQSKKVWKQKRSFSLPALSIRRFLLNCGELSLWLKNWPPFSISRSRPRCLKFSKKSRLKRKLLRRNWKNWAQELQIPMLRWLTMPGRVSPHFWGFSRTHWRASRAESTTKTLSALKLDNNLMVSIKSNTMMQQPKTSLIRISTKQWSTSLVTQLSQVSPQLMPSWPCSIHSSKNFNHPLMISITECMNWWKMKQWTSLDKFSQPNILNSIPGSKT